jgi:phosphate transport system substrate-binding protein
MRSRRRYSFAILAVALALLAVLAAGCGGDDETAEPAAPAEPAPAEAPAEPPAEPPAGELSGSIEADGSSTVGPFTSYAAELFQEENPDVQVTVGISGTGGGFERFCAGETDISNASRPIDEEEIAICADAGIEYVELHVVNDGLAVVVNPENDWVDCFTVEQLNTIWAPEAEGTVTNWNQVDPSFPDEPLVLAGPGTDSGTFDYFTETVNGDGGASRADYTASEDDNIIVQAVSGEVGGTGYFGLSYVAANEGAIKAVPVQNDAGDCVSPSVETVQDGSYNPLGRPLFIYAKVESFQRPEVQAFMQYVIDNNSTIAEGALYVPLTDEQLATAQAGLDEALAAAGA